MESLEINTNYFERGGVIGRWDFIKYSFIYSVAFYIASFGIGAILTVARAPLAVGILTQAGFILFNLYLNYINAYKRLRDIRGTTEDQTSAQVKLTIGLILPLINLFVAFWLVFTAGKITSGTSETHPERAYPDKAA